MESRPLCAQPGCSTPVSRKDRTYCLSHRPQSRRTGPNPGLVAAAAERRRIIDTAPVPGRVVIVAGFGYVSVERWVMPRFGAVRLVAAENGNTDALVLPAWDALPSNDAAMRDVLTLYPCPQNLADLAEWPE